jgi:uncharacterized protein YggU (UPF0235/DUF167 family)
VEPAEDGKANGAVLALLAQVLQVPRHDLEVTAGRASRDKLVVLAGLSSEAVDERLSAAVGGAR